MFLDLYAIQPVPPSNINRDDTGSPKTAIYGGVQRARVSSQAWKRAMRVMFPYLLPQGKFGIRTKLALEHIAQCIREQAPEFEAEAETLAKGVLEAAAKLKKKDSLKIETPKSEEASEGTQATKTECLVFITKSEINDLANLAIEWHRQGKNVSEATTKMKNEASEKLDGAQAVDIALFGRMLAGSSNFNIDASAQVAHAISVDRVTQEYDFFTALDDCVSDDNSGAAHLNTTAFNSSTLYRYATVDVDALNKQIGDHVATAEATAAFVEAFARSMPTGKQNTFANRTLPTLFAVVFRSDQPINPVSAFESPVYPKENESISQQAAKLLGSELERIEGVYGLKANKAWHVSVAAADEELSASLGAPITFKELLGNVRDYVTSRLGVEKE